MERIFEAYIVEIRLPSGKFPLSDSLQFYSIRLRLHYWSSIRAYASDKFLWASLIILFASGDAGTLFSYQVQPFRAFFVWRSVGGSLKVGVILIGSAQPQTKVASLIEFSPLSS